MWGSKKKNKLKDALEYQKEILARRKIRQAYYVKLEQEKTQHKTLSDIQPSVGSFSIKQCSAGWYDVVDSDGNSINKKPMRLETAKKRLARCSK